MKRCPTCNRFEPDDALAFCRVDGTSLISYSDVSSMDAGTVKFGSGTVETDADTSLLPPATDGRVIGLAAPTSILPAHPVLRAAHGGNTKRGRLTLLIVSAMVVAAIICAAVYFFLSRAKRPAIDSVAVLPFQNASRDPNTEYLSDGISEALINSLAELHQLRVIARTTTFRYKGKDVDPLQIGRDLNVRSVLTGSVRQAGDNLAIQVDLVDATTGAYGPLR